MPGTNNWSLRHNSWFHGITSFFVPDKDKFNASLAIAKIVSCCKKKSLNIDIGGIDKSKSLSFFFAIDKLLDAGVLTTENFKLLKAMDRDKPKKYIESFNNILYLFKKNGLLTDKSFRMAYEKIDELDSEEMIILESTIFELDHKELLNQSTIAYLSVCEIAQFRIFSLVIHKWLRNDVDEIKQLFTIEPSKLEKLFVLDDYTTDEVREILEKNKTDRFAVIEIFAPRP